MSAKKKTKASTGKASGREVSAKKTSSGKSSSRGARPSGSMSEKIACMAVDIIRSALEEGDRKAAFWVLEHHPKSPFRKDFAPEPEGKIEVSFGRIDTASGSTSNAG